MVAHRRHTPTASSIWAPSSQDQANAGGTCIGKLNQVMITPTQNLPHPPLCRRMATTTRSPWQVIAILDEKMLISSAVTRPTIMATEAIASNLPNAATFTAQLPHLDGTSASVGEPDGGPVPTMMMVCAPCSPWCARCQCGYV